MRSEELRATAPGPRKRLDAELGGVYWIRQDNEVATGTSLPTGFVVVLNHDITTPGGRRENLFLARALYDDKGTTFRRLLRGWLKKLGLSNKNLSGGTWGFEVILPDAPVFRGDHVIVDEIDAA